MDGGGVHICAALNVRSRCEDIFMRPENIFICGEYAGNMLVPGLSRPSSPFRTFRV